MAGGGKKSKRKGNDSKEQERYRQQDEANRRAQEEEQKRYRELDERNRRDSEAEQERYRQLDYQNAQNSFMQQYQQSQAQQAAMQQDNASQIQQQQAMYAQQQQSQAEAYAQQMMMVQQEQRNREAALYQQMQQSQQMQQQQLAEAQKPRMAQFNPSLYSPDYATLQNQFSAAQQNYQKGRQQYDQYEQDGLYSGEGANVISSYQPQLQGMQGFQQAGQGAYAARQVQESELPMYVQNMTDWNQQLQGSYQGLLSQIANLNQYGSELYNRGVQREGELKQNRLSERSNYYATEATRNALTTAGRAEQAGATRATRQRGRVASASNSSGYLSNLTRGMT